MLARMVSVPFEECPRYDCCSVNRCPLDPEIAKRPVDPADKEQRCRAQKSVRIRIAQGYADLLPMGGLTEHEYAIAQRESRLTPEQRAARLARLLAAKDKSPLKMARS